MANQIRMTPDKMRSRSKETEKQKKAVSDVIRYMDKLLENLKGEWEGEAVRGYEERYNKIKPTLINAEELLGEIAYNLNETARIVEDTDKNIASQFRK